MVVREKLIAGVEALRAGDPRRAVEQAEEVIRAQPEIGAAHLLLGRALLELNQAEQAATALRKAVELDPDSGELSGTTAAEQARRCLENVGAILQAGGGSFAAVVKTTVYLTDLAQFASVNEAYAEFFTGDLPARSVVPVAALPKGALVAVEAIASLSE